MNTGRINIRESGKFPYFWNILVCACLDRSDSHMANAQGGFDAVFVVELSERLICPICQLALKAPQLTKCGHHFCKTCLYECLSRRGVHYCPTCRRKLKRSEIFPNNALKREILDLNIKCDQLKKGCQWMGELRSREDHDEECPYVDEKCSNECGDIVIRRAMENHLQEQCPRRMTRCEHCDLRMEWNELEHHYEKCPNYPVECRYNCGETLLRHKMAEHVGHQGTCPKSILDCKLKDVGCLFRGNRQELVKHGKDDADSHCSLLASELVATKRELEETKSKLAIVSNRSFSHPDSMFHMHRRSRESFKGFFLPVSHSFVHTWTIENWSQKIMEAKADSNESVDSNPFYVPPGYHLYLRAYANHKDTSYLAVFFFVTEGDFDGNIKWPFPFSFTIEVVDQQPHGTNISKKCSPPYDGALDRAPDQGYGEPETASHKKLEKRCYIKDDAIVIKLIAHLEND